MIVVDTNVISELWRLAPDSRVLAWMDAQAIETLHLSAVTVAELRYGIAAMPEGRRRTIYQERLEHEVLPAFAGRVLAFDLDAAKAYAEQMAIDGRDPGKQADHRDVRDAYADEQLEHGLSPFAPMKELAVVAAL